MSIEHRTSPMFPCDRFRPCWRMGTYNLEVTIWYTTG